MDKAICISNGTDTLGKGMNPIILVSSMDKLLGRQYSLTRVWQTVSKNENSEFKSVKLRLKSTLSRILLMQRGWYIYIYIYIYIYTRWIFPLENHSI